MTQVHKSRGANGAPALPEFDAVLPRTRRARVADTLRSFILSGQLAPGTQLVESKLASSFGVSRGSIREAIWALIDQGLLVNRPYAGTFVVSLGEKTMTEVFSLRGALERYCFIQLWPKRDQTFRKEFTARHKALVKARSGRGRTSRPSRPRCTSTAILTSSRETVCCSTSGTSCHRRSS